MKSIYAVVLAIAAVALAGCLPVTTKTPVGTTVGLTADPALYGTWKGHNPGEKDQHDGFFHFLKAKDSSMTAAVIIAGGESDDEWTIYNVRTATLGGNHYINALGMFDNGPSHEGNFKKDPIPLRYVIKGQTLTLYLIDEDKAKAAIAAGKIKGTIAPGNDGDVTITAEAKELDDFMAKPEAKAMFKLLLVLKKVE